LTHHAHKQTNETQKERSGDGEFNRLQDFSRIARLQVTKKDDVCSDGTWLDETQ
jgi:hypothetical protein